MSFDLSVLSAAMAGLAGIGYLLRRLAESSDRD
jgi:hypothetical protein